MTSSSLDEQISSLMLENIESFSVVKYDKKHYHQVMILGIKLMLEGTDNSNRQNILDDIPECFSYYDDSYMYDDDVNRLWVLVNGETVYGFINVFIEDGDAMISGIYLETHLRGTGLANEMLNKAIEFCKEKDCDKILIEVPSYSPSAVRFCLKNGFDYYMRKMEYNDTVKMLHYKLEL